MDDSARGRGPQRPPEQPINGGGAALQRRLRSLGVPEATLTLASADADAPLADADVQEGEFLRHALQHLARAAVPALMLAATDEALESYLAWADPAVPGPVEILRDCRAAARELEEGRERLEKIRQQLKRMTERYDLTVEAALQPALTGIEAAQSELADWTKRLEEARAQWYGRQRAASGEQLKLVTRLHDVGLSGKSIAALLMLIGTDEPADLENAERRINLLRQRNQE